MLAILDSHEYEATLITDDAGGNRPIEFDFNDFDEDEQDEISELNVGDSVTLEYGLDDIVVKRIA